MDLIGGIHDSLSLHVLTPFPVYTGQRGPPRVPHSKRSTKVCVFVDKLLTGPTNNESTGSRIGCAPSCGRHTEQTEY